MPTIISPVATSGGAACAAEGNNRALSALIVTMAALSDAGEKRDFIKAFWLLARE
jgi:hypothetical protein